MEISAARQLTVRGTRDSASRILLRLLVPAHIARAPEATSS